MKSAKSIVSVVLLAAAGAVSAHADTYRCTEIVRNPGAAASRGRTSVIVRETADITRKVSYGNRFDHVYAVNVDVRETRNGRTETVKAFKSVATVTDVDYLISAVRSQGVKIAIFLDEPADAWMARTSPSGRKVTTFLDCEPN